MKCEKAYRIWNDNGELLGTFQQMEKRHGLTWVKDFDGREGLFFETGESVIPLGEQSITFDHGYYTISMQKKTLHYASENEYLLNEQKSVLYYSLCGEEIKLSEDFFIEDANENIIVIGNVSTEKVGTAFFSGKIIMPIEYDKAYIDAARYVHAVKDGLMGIFYEDGECVLPCTWKNIGTPKNGIVAVKNKQGLVGAYSLHFKKKILGCNWRSVTIFDDQIEALELFSERIITFTLSGERIVHLQKERS